MYIFEHRVTERTGVRRDNLKEWDIVCQVYSVVGKQAEKCSSMNGSLRRLCS